MGAVGQGGVAQLLDDARGNVGHALGALALGAELVVVDHLGQAIDARGQGFLAVLVEEELGIGQARAHHTLIATNHQVRVRGTDVADHQKLVGQLVGRVQQGEVFLVGLHGQDQALLRHVQKLPVKLAQQHVRALYQRGHFVQQGGVINRAHALPHACRHRFQLARDFGAACRERGDNGAIARQRLGIAVGIGQLHRRDRGLEAVPLGAAPGRQAQRLHRHHATAVQRHQTMRRTHEMHATPARQRAVALQLVGHEFGDGEQADGFVQRLLQTRVQRRAADQGVVEQGFVLAVRRALERGHGSHRVADIGAQGLQLLDQRRCRLAAGVQAHGYGHEFLLHRLVGGLAPDVADMGGQAARRGIGGGDRVAIDQAKGAQLLGQLAGKGIAQFFQRLRG